jgi:hypothetical protein
MPFDLASVETSLRLIDWRNDQLDAITAQLEEAFPRLAEAIVNHVAGLSTVEVGKAHLNPKKLAEQLIAPWAETQSITAISRAEASLSDLISKLPQDNGLNGHINSALPAMAGVGMLAASVLGLPAVVSFATVTTTSFFVISTSAVSIPLLLAGGTVLAGMSFAGVKAVDQAKDKMRANLIARVQSIALSAVFGYGLAAEARCLLNDLQAAVLKSGETELGAIG